MHNWKNSVCSKTKRVYLNCSVHINREKRGTSDKFPVLKNILSSWKQQSTEFNKISSKKAKCGKDTKINTISLDWKSTNTGSWTITWWTKINMFWVMRETETKEVSPISMKWKVWSSSSNGNLKCWGMSATKEKIQVRSTMSKIMRCCWRKRTMLSFNWPKPETSFKFLKAK